MTTVRKVKRVKRKINKPNPLFEKWLTEWKEEASARGSKMQYCFAKALHSLKKYPLPLNSGKECRILQNFGIRLSIMIDRKLAEYKSNNLKDGLLESIDVDERTCIQPNKVDSSGLRCKKRNSQSTPKNRQTPKSTSINFDPYLLLITLLNESQQTGFAGLLSKSELVSKTELLCHQQTMSKDLLPDMTLHINTLIASGHIVYELNKYRLSEEGTEAAISHLTKFPEFLNSSPIQDNSGVANNQKHQNKGKKLTARKKGNRIIQEKNVDIEQLDDDVVITFSGNALTVILLVDTAETSGKPRDDAVSTLHALGAEFEVRHLKVGDFAWIIRNLQTGCELMLPYIVERKRIDDFSKSIMDGRFHEQKFRLKKCGLQNLIYLVESHKHDKHAVLLLSTLQQAAVNTQIVDGFTVKYTDNHRESMVYLATLTNVFKRKLNHKTIASCRKESLPKFSISDDTIYLMTFAEFSKVAKKKKNFQVKEIFMKQLLQLYGLSVEKASAITQLYPTPRLLFDALHVEDRGELLSNISYGLTNRRIGPVISKAVHLLYTSKF